MSENSVINLTSNTTATTVAGVPQLVTKGESNSTNPEAQFKAALEGASSNGQNITQTSKNSQNSNPNATPNGEAEGTTTGLEGIIQSIMLENSPVEGGVISPLTTTGNEKTPTTASGLTIIPNNNGEIVVTAAGTSKVQPAQPAITPQTAETIIPASPLTPQNASEGVAQTEGGDQKAPNGVHLDTFQALSGENIIINKGGETITPNGVSELSAVVKLEQILTGQVPVTQVSTVAASTTAAPTLNQGPIAPKTVSGKVVTNNGVVNASEAITGQVASQSEINIAVPQLTPEEAQSLKAQGIAQDVIANNPIAQTVSAALSGKTEISVAATPSDALQANVETPTKVNAEGLVSNLTPEQQQNKFKEMLQSAQSSPLTLSNKATVGDASTIIDRLQGMGIPYQLRNDGRTVFAASDQISQLRVTLAGEGLGGSIVGNEIFDRGDNLGTTSFVQNINKIRAIEGELARTIAEINNVASARVHIVMPERQLFSQSERTASAHIEHWLKSVNIL